MIALNATMFLVEMSAGQMAQSLALQADALDFPGDAPANGLSLAVIGKSIRIRSTAALAKGISLALMGTRVFGATLYRVFYAAMPEAPIMAGIGFLALATIVASVPLLVCDKDGDANMRPAMSRQSSRHWPSWARQQAGPM